MIIYSATAKINVKQFIELSRHANSPRQITDGRRIDRLLHNANLLYSAWNDDTLVGVVRGFSDEAYCCYLADVVIRKCDQSQEIERKLISKIHRDLGPGISLVLKASSTSLPTYLKLGFKKVDSGFELVSGN